MKINRIEKMKLDVSKVKVFIYMRYSCDKQNYTSIEAQRRAITEYCNANDYEIVAEYVDEAKSAKNANRPQFQQMISDARKADIYAIIVHKFDRFARNRNDSIFYKALLQKSGVKLISVLEQLDDTPESKMLEGMIETMNEFYIMNLAREVNKGKEESAHKGLFLGGVPPYGYDVDENRKYVINHKESKAIKRIFDMYINDYSYQQIADTLNRYGYRTKKGLKFNKNSFSSILENAEIYTGMYMYNKAESKRIDGTRNSHKRKDDSAIIRIKDGMPRIISDETYLKTVEKRRLNKELAGRYHSKRYYLLNGLVKCGECGRAFSGNTSFAGRNKTKYSTYRCGGYRIGCHSKAVNIDYLNDFVLDMLIDIIFYKKNYKNILKRLNKKLKKDNDKIKNVIISLKNELVQKNSVIEKMYNSLSEDSFIDVKLEAINRLEEEKEKLQNKINNYEQNKEQEFTFNDINEVKKKFKKFLLKKDLIICRKFIRSFVEVIYIYEDIIEVVLKTSKSSKSNIAS